MFSMHQYYGCMYYVCILWMQGAGPVEFPDIRDIAAHSKGHREPLKVPQVHSMQTLKHHDMNDKVPQVHSPQHEAQ